MPRRCALCSKDLSAKQLGKMQTYCSRVCSAGGRNRSVEKICTVCSTKFKSHNKYCSQKCRYEGSSAKWASPEKLMRTCSVCAKTFLVPVPSSRKLTCSTVCFGECISVGQTGRVASAEANARRSKSLKDFNLANSDKLASRIAAAANGLRAFYADSERSADWRKTQSKRLQNHMASDKGQEWKIRNVRALKRAHEALRSTTQFVEFWTLALERLRTEHPFPDGGDYADYCCKIGKLVTADVDVRRCTDVFMSENLGRFIKEEYARAPLNSI